ncbi:MAG TPA: DUF4440 domain-containing protein [Terriglobales bacterium]|nr:DUF4440 domain-containing protein [Terriglobales bacterium]
MNDCEQIERAIADFIAAYNAGHLSGVLVYYADDLIKIRQGGPSETRAETAQRLTGVFAKFASRVEVCNEETVAEGGIGYTRGMFRVTLTPRSGGESQVMERRYLEIWRKQRGRWMVARTIDNAP